MAENTKIAWCDHTINWWIGCQKVSPACENCYAEGTANRFWPGHWGPDAPRLLRLEAAGREAMRYQRRAAGQNGTLRVFANSMSDFFEDRRDLDRARLEALDVMRRTPNLIWLLLTKRPEKILAALRECLLPSYKEKRYSLNGWLEEWLVGSPPNNIWLGTTAENQEWADKRVPDLLQAPAAKRFLSCEPLLGPIDLTREYSHDRCGGSPPFSRILDPFQPTRPINLLDWVIVGCESGPRRRPMFPAWALSLKNQCAAARIPFFFKQAEIEGKIVSEPFLNGAKHLAFPEEVLG